MKKVLLLCVAALAFAGPALADSAARQFELGSKNYARCRYDRALHHFQKALALASEEREKRAAAYAVKTLTDNRDELALMHEAEVRFAGSSDAAARAALAARHLLFARKLMNSEFYISFVEPHLTRALKLDPGNAAAHIDLAAACYATMQYDKTVAACKRAIARFPDIMVAYRLAGDASVAIGDFDAAKKFYTDLLEKNATAAHPLSPKEVDAANATLKVLPETYKDVDGLLKEGRYDEAETILRKKLSLNASDYIAMTALGTIYQDRSDRKAALKLFKTAVRIAPDYPIAHLYLGRLHYLMRKPEDAIDEFNAFKMRMKLLPTMDKDTRKMYTDDLYYLIEVYASLDRYDDVKSQIDEIFRMDPNAQDAYYCLGIYHYVYEHNRSRAYQAFKKVIELDPSTDAGQRAAFAIDYIRTNPDSRLIPDFSFIDRE